MLDHYMAFELSLYSKYSEFLATAHKPEAKNVCLIGSIHFPLQFKEAAKGDGKTFSGFKNKSLYLQLTSSYTILAPIPYYSFKIWGLCCLYHLN